MANLHALPFHLPLSTEKIQYRPQVYNVSTEERKAIAQTTLKKNIPLNTSEE